MKPENNPARNDGESFERYKARRADLNAQIKRKLKGRLLWDTAENGKYVKSVHGPLK